MGAGFWFFFCFRLVAWFSCSAAPSGYWVELRAAQLSRHPSVHLNGDCGVIILYRVNLSIVVHFHGASDVASDGASLW